MKTDVPLKRLTRLRPQDIVAFLGLEDVDVVGVETLELPTTAHSLDTVLRLRHRDGQEYLLLIEWQGWRDPIFLWRVLDYLAWLGQNRPERPILVLIIYLTPESDVGDTLVQELTGHSGWTVRFPCLRLWQQDAATALASGKPGLLALLPLMHGVTEAMVEQAARQLIITVDSPIQEELLSALGVFAEAFVDTERFLQFVTKERLMSSNLISYLFKDQLEEFAKQKALLEEQLAAQDERLAAQDERMRHTLQQAVEDVIIARFPDAPAALTRRIRNIHDSAQLPPLISTVATAPDLAAVAAALAAAAEQR
ncbi:MAG: hypothetical protein MUD01_27190 [Chloroflexaceae bacterium]|jgi:hypothetical protein|nr:hypothetical protein [Chloroflexaceae bacterium]